MMGSGNIIYGGFEEDFAFKIGCPWDLVECSFIRGSEEWYFS